MDIWDWIVPQKEPVLVENATPEWSPVSLCLGILLTVVGAFIISIGSLLDASERRHEQSHMSHMLPQRMGVSYEMLVGMALVIVGNALHVGGLWLAPASLLAPTNAVGLVSTHILAKIMFNDPVTFSAWISTVGISVGIVICGISSANAGTVGLTSDQRHVMYLSTWADRTYQIFVTLLVLLIGGIYTIIFELEIRQSAEEFITFRNQPHFSAYELIPNEVQEQATGQGDDGHKQHLLGQTHGNLLAILAGIIGSQTVCEIKEVESLCHEIARNGFKGLAHFKSSLISLPLLVVCGLGQWPYLNLAYRVGSPQLVSACYYVSWTALGSVGGFVKFKEHHGMSFNEKVYYGIGLAINLASILFACSKSIQDLTRFYLFPDKSAQSPEVQVKMESMRAKVLANFMAAPFMDRVLPDIHVVPNPHINHSETRATTMELARHHGRRLPARAVYSSNVSL
eukprot:Gregarina_sp_Poly_1__10535@NODE_777_length_6336_cov_483_824374_g571_i0_p3_GENE_NODE_777_length_6336_cov_483_824374_g571_i0NODE_777_length_6336_cov_483_824374_g571_i0_p3_ORF_typecomplete_len455_score43_99Mg_trans_NIPA/PF05653_14/6_8e31Nuc_sug_transp/PF04142_15/8_8e06PUNUT/PF16913_5/0_00072EamA/PF00892_20/0_0013EamA/PF00892_20/6e03EamA/PF00892_20/4_2e02TMEM234/PF10639_9/0_0022TMEM234/PF10639_9/1_3e04CRTlike/PF08627_10/0_05DUF4083/PF13314_6/36DUF4083/PF13314_6/3_1LapA_dom/PF06305_11/9_2e02LapA_dom/